MISHYINQPAKLLLALPFALLIIACSSTDSTPGTEVHAHLTHLPAAAPEPDVTNKAMAIRSNWPPPI